MSNEMPKRESGEVLVEGVSSRHSAVDEAIIQAARESIMTVGLSRTSIAEIARNAGVSRPTIYRRYADIGELSSEVINREVVRLLEGLTDLPGNALEGVAARFRIVVERVGASEFLRSLIETDPERVLKSLTNTQTDTQLQIVRAYVLPAIRQGHEDGSIRQHDPYALSNNVFRLMQATAVLWTGLVSDAVEHQDPIDEVVDMVTRYLKP
ncbi:TetR/AcrR family transcriptional regulator [Corynebacterium sp. H113]|uniref:TetR/AcrR family transcriptional regulator n=1 Tax=Corynebacterium sp. H113 TaxID=3133419 RepID=UPI0030A2C196